MLPAHEAAMKNVKISCKFRLLASHASQPAGLFLLGASPPLQFSTASGHVVNAFAVGLERHRVPAAPAAEI
jgi:hypothetical protein